MLDKRIQPVIISKLHDPLMPIISPRCSLEFRILSPRSLKNSDPIGGVGLGIVAALEKLQSGVPVVGSSSTQSTARSNPVPINGTKYSKDQSQDMESESWEEYTYVTCHRPNNTYTKMYCDRGEIGGAGHDRGRNSSAVNGSSKPGRTPVENKEFPTSDFLSSCYLCRKKLHGKDIYMYRGEKAFCSTECRYTQIVVDKRTEKCGSEMSRSVEAPSCSPYSRDNIFFTGIFAT